MLRAGYICTLAFCFLAWDHRLTGYSLIWKRALQTCYYASNNHHKLINLKRGKILLCIEKNIQNYFHCSALKENFAATSSKGVFHPTPMKVLLTSWSDTLPLMWHPDSPHLSRNVSSGKWHWSLAGMPPMKESLSHEVAGTPCKLMLISQELMLFCGEV